MRRLMLKISRQVGGMASPSMLFCTDTGKLKLHSNDLKHWDTFFHKIICNNNVVPIRISASVVQLGVRPTDDQEVAG